ncbi:MAG: hypothetical protein KGO93_01745 [Cyanobacteria bacterium REEB446]|nr:hypothetical protein [Cyanobacteria bacterium REEB446]
MNWFNRGVRAPVIQNLRQQQSIAQQAKFIREEPSEGEATPVPMPDLSFDNLTDTMKTLFRKLYADILSHGELGPGSSREDNGKSGQNYVKILGFIKQNTTRLCEENARVQGIKSDSDGAKLNDRALASFTLHHLENLDRQNSCKKYNAIETLRGFLLPEKKMQEQDDEGYWSEINKDVCYEPVIQDNYAFNSTVKAYRFDDMQQISPALKENYMALYENINSLLNQGGHPGNFIAEVMKFNRSNEDAIAFNIQQQHGEFPVSAKDAVIYDVSLNILKEIATQRGDSQIQKYLGEAQKRKINSMTIQESVDGYQPRALGSIAPQELDSGLGYYELESKDSRNHEARMIFDPNVKPELIKEGFSITVLDLYQALIDARYFDFKDTYSRIKIQGKSPQGQEILDKISYIDSAMNDYAQALGIQSNFTFGSQAECLINEEPYRIATPQYMAEGPVIKVSDLQSASVQNISSPNIMGRKNASIDQSPVAEMPLEEVKFWKSELSTKKMINSGNPSMLTAIQTLENVIQSRVDSHANHNPALLLTVNQAYSQLRGGDLNSSPEAKMTINTLAEEIKMNYNRMFSFLGLNSAFQTGTSIEDKQISLKQRKIV